jgi:hypothetical protein
VDYAVEHPYRVKLIRARTWLRAWVARILYDTRSPFVDASARLQIVGAIVTTLIILPYQDNNLIGEITAQIPGIGTLVLILVVFLLVNAAFSALFVTSSIKKLGTWHRHQFIYHTPKVVFTTVVTAADNGRLIPFKIDDAEIGGGVELTLVSDGFGKNELRVRFSDPCMTIPWDNYERHTMLAHMFKDRLFYIESMKPTPSNQSTVKVLFNSWYGRTHESPLLERPKPTV